MNIISGSGEIVGTALDDSITGGRGDDTITGLAGNDTINGNGGNDVLSGGDGDDSLSAGFGAATLQGGAGDDRLVFESSSEDGQFYTGGLGQDTLELQSNPSADGLALGAEASIETLVFSGPRSDIVTFIGKNDVVVDLTGINDIRVDITGDEEIETAPDFRFSSGGTFLGSEFSENVFLSFRSRPTATEAGPYIVRANGGDDTINVFYEVELVDGGAGDDLIIFAARDTDVTSNVFQGGEGRDTIQFEIISNGFNVELGVGQSIEILAFPNETNVSDDSYAIGTFDDIDLTWDLSGIEEYSAPKLLRFGGGNDTFIGSQAADNIIANGGDDTLVGGLGDDTLYGGTDGGSSDDGNDLLTGGEGADTFAFRSGLGNDTITDFNPDEDSLEINGIGGVNLPSVDQMTVVNDPSQVGVFTLGSEFGSDLGTISFQGIRFNTGSLDFVFVDGILRAGQTLTVDTAGADDPDGIATSFSYQWYRSGEAIEGSISGVRTLTEEDIGSRMTLEVSYTDGNGNSEIVRSEATGIIASADVNLVGTPNDDRLSGDNGNDTIVGLDGNDTLEGGFEGNDSINGGNGTDRISGGSGDDTLIGGDSEDDLRDLIFGGEGNDLIDGGYGNDELRGDAGNDTIAGGFGADTVIGGTGDDILTGSALGDNLFGGDGDDFVNGGFGFDRVNGGEGADKFFHLGIANHGADWIQDYDSAEGDVLVFGNQNATRSQFQINVTTTPTAGLDDVEEAFIVYRPTGQIMWALVDGDGQDEINLQIGGDVFDLMA